MNQIGITPEIVKYGGSVVVEWMTMICDLAWRQGEVPDEWRKAIIVPLHLGKGSKDECNNYRGVSLLSVPGRMYGGVLTSSFSPRMHIHSFLGSNKLNPIPFL